MAFACSQRYWPIPSFKREGRELVKARQAKAPDVPGL
jgi:hypothetical protein